MNAPVVNAPVATGPIVITAKETRVPIALEDRELGRMGVSQAENRCDNNTQTKGLLTVIGTNGRVRAWAHVDEHRADRRRLGSLASPQLQYQPYAAEEYFPTGMRYLAYHNDNGVFCHEVPEVFVTVGVCYRSILRNPMVGRQIIVEPLTRYWRPVATRLRYIVGTRDIRVPTMSGRLAIQSIGPPQDHAERAAQSQAAQAAQIGE